MQSIESQPAFWRKMLPLSSGLKNKDKQETRMKHVASKLIAWVIF
jgi:hypothetical protein